MGTYSLKFKKINHNNGAEIHPGMCILEQFKWEIKSKKEAEIEILIYGY